MPAAIMLFSTVMLLAGPPVSGAPEKDWLITPVTKPATVQESSDGTELLLSNGLISRRFRLKPNAATVALDNLMIGQSMLRAVKPEARLRINGRTFDVGGLKGQPDHAYLLDEWLIDMKADPCAFHFVGYEVGPTVARFAWKRVRHGADQPWPPPGVSLTMNYQVPANAIDGSSAPLEDVAVSVHYEMYQSIPLLCKWLTVRNGSDRAIRLNSFTSEVLAMVEYESHVERYGQWNVPNIHVESDYAFGGMNAVVANHTTYWERDPEYLTRVSYLRENPCLLESRPPVGPDIDIAPGETFESFRTFELIFDSTDRERKGLAMRRMYRTVAPWVTENPLMMHVRRADGRDIDCLMHVNPQLEMKALALVYNPLDEPVRRDLVLPLYYTGLTDVARVRQEDGAPTACKLDRQYNVTIPVRVQAHGSTWLTVE